MSRKIRLILICIISIAFIGCDHATKELAKDHLKDKAPRSWYHDTFRLEYVENTGAFLSLGDGWSSRTSFWIMSILPLIFLSGLFIYTIRKSANTSLKQLFPLVLIFSGGIGNIVDRIVYDRHVTDFMNLGFNNLRTGIFNFADVYVTTGVIILLIASFKKNREEKTENVSA